jgi:hypothetical protein
MLSPLLLLAEMNYSVYSIKDTPENGPRRIELDLCPLLCRAPMSTRSIRLVGSIEERDEETVKVHLKRITRKLHAKDRTQAIAIAVRRGVIQI